MARTVVLGGGVCGRATAMLLARDGHEVCVDTDLDAVVRCIDRRRPDLVLVTRGFGPSEDQPERWNTFVARGRALLRSSYRLLLTDGSIQIWAA